MPPSSESSRSGTAVLLSAPGLSVVALVLFVLFASLVTPALFPLQLLDPTWQLRLAGTLINSAAFPLLGLALLQIAAELGPHDPLLKNRAHLCSQLAVAAALGFLLLLPLQTIAGLRTSRTVNNAQDSRIQGAEAKLKALRQVVAGAASNADLNVQLQKLSGPVLGPADIAQPLLLLPELLRKALASLALALGFAALARPGGLAPISRCCRSCKTGSGAPSRAAPPAVPPPPMPIISSSSAAGIGNPEGMAVREDIARYRRDQVSRMTINPIVVQGQAWGHATHRQAGQRNRTLPPGASGRNRPGQEHPHPPADPRSLATAPVRPLDHRAVGRPPRSLPRHPATGQR